VPVADACYDVAIVGAGIAGSALAVALSGHGLSTVLIEAQPLELSDLPQGSGLQDFDPRVSALTPRSRALLEELGAWDAIAGYRLCSYRHMTVWDAQGTGEIEFDCAEVGVSALGHIVENRSITRSLLAQVLAAPDITVLSPVRLSACTAGESGVSLELEDGAVLSADLLVAADGALSKVRDMMEFKTREWDYGHRAIVTTVQVEQPHQATAWQRFLPTGPLAFLPLSGREENFCSIVWSVQEQLVDELLALEEDKFCVRLERAFEGRLGRIQGCSPRFAFPLRQRHALDYVQAGVALVGDAAHTIHPLAGQGINLGLQDVAVLADEICSGKERGTSPGDLALLRRYQRRRKGENMLMMAAMDGFKRLFEQEALPLRWLRNVGMRGVDRIAPLKQRLIRHAMGVG
jgi:2-octaprenylphenol hydroxylase